MATPQCNFTERNLDTWVRSTLAQWATHPQDIPATGEQWLADRGGPGSIPGLFLRLRLGREDGAWSLGTVTTAFYLLKKIAGRKVNRLIGDRAVLSVEAARQQAKELLAKLLKGEDPREERRKEQEVKDLRALTYQQALEGFLAVADITDGTRKKYRLSLATTFKDVADKPLTWFTRERVRQIHKARTTESRSRADQDMRVLRLVWNWAAQSHRTETGEAVLGPHPVAVLNKRQRGPGQRGWNNVPRKETTIPRAQLPAWFEALHQIRDEPITSPTRRLSCLLLEALVLSGLRFRELADLPWTQVNLVAGTLTVPDASSKNRRALVRPLTRRVREILEQLQREYSGPLLFPGRGNRKGRTDPQPIDNTVALQEELRDRTGLWATPHDLRRVWASAATRAGLPTVVLKRLLNHLGHEEVTEGYVRLGLDELQEHAQAVEDTILGDAGLLASKGLDAKLQELLAGLDEATKRRLLFELAQQRAGVANG